MDGEIGHDRVTGVGSALRACRLKHGIPLADIARALRIRQSFLAAIEDGRFSDLPGPTYAVGFARAYGEFLGLDGDEVVRRLRAEEQSAAPSAELHFPTPSSETSTPRAGVLLVGALVAALAYGGWYVLTANEQLVSGLTDPIPDRLGSLIAGSPTAEDADDAAPGGDTLPGDTLPDAVSGSPPPLGANRWGGSPVATPPTAEDRTAEAAQGDRDLRAPAASRPARESSAARAYAATAEATSEAGTARRGGGGTTAAPTADQPEAPTASAPASPERTAAVAPAAPSETGAAAEPPEPAADAPPEPASAPPEPASAGSSATDTADPAQITIRATEASWLEVRDRRGRRLTGRLMQPGDTYEVPDQEGLLMTVGNAGGVRLAVNGKPLPPLGESGEVRRGVSLDPQALRGTATP